MISFKQFINETYNGKINWVKPNHQQEHDEVHHQLANHDPKHMPDWVHSRLSELKDKNKFKKAIDNGKAKTLSRNDVKNTGNTGERWSEVEKNSKVRRAATLYGKNKSVQKPVYLEHPKTKERWLVGGHHRSTYVSDVLKKPVEAHVIK